MNAIDSALVLEPGRPVEMTDVQEEGEESADQVYVLYDIIYEIKL